MIHSRSSAIILYLEIIFHRGRVVACTRGVFLTRLSLRCVELPKFRAMPLPFRKGMSHGESC